MKKCLAMLTATLLLTGCAGTTPIEHQPPVPDEGAVATGEPTEPPVFQVELPEIQLESTQLYTEAEKSRLYGNLKVESARKGYSGSGYVTGFNKDPSNQLIVSCYVPTTQHYDLSVCVAADKTVKNRLVINNNSAVEFTLEGDGTFIQVVFHNIFLEAGSVSVSIEEIDGGLDLDYIALNNSTELYSLEYKAEAKPINKNASDNARRLLQNMTDCYGKGVLTGQYASTAENKELELIHEMTGQYPAIRCGDLGVNSDGSTDNAAEIAAAKAWAGTGGIVSFMWYWPEPLTHTTVYSKNTDFSLSRAMTDEDIVMLDSDGIDQKLAEKKISLECASILHDIDTISEQLQQLNDKEIPVLWRPLHEAGGGWYWWGSDGAEAYQWLWRLLYERMTRYHHLDNLIWVWNGQSEAYYVGDDLFDIASIDVYLSPGEDYGSRSGQFQWLYTLTGGKKLLALSECSSLPEVDAMYRDKAVWSFFGLWYGNYLMKNDGSFNNTYTTEDALRKLYQSEGSITLSEYADIARKARENE